MSYYYDTIAEVARTLKYDVQKTLLVQHDLSHNRVIP
jgi:hypothetical protein